MFRQTLFTAGAGGHACYRIPTLITLPSGRLIVFCEARTNGAGDCGTIRIVARISDDNGATFSKTIDVADNSVNTLGNPVPVYDNETKTLFLLVNGNLIDGDERAIMRGEAPRTVLYTSSIDDGLTWSPLRDLTSELMLSDWGWYAMGPCHAARLSGGRLLVPCNHSILDPASPDHGKYISHTVYSDDHGATWRIGGSVGPNTNECSLTELPDGRVYMNMRSYHGEHCRATSFSGDGGLTWSPVHLEHALPDPVCQGSTLYAPKLGRLLFSNVAHPTQRIRVTLRSSADLGQSWSEGVVLHEGPSAYSDIAELADGRIACIFECGSENPYEQIVLAILDPREVV